MPGPGSAPRFWQHLVLGLIAAGLAGYAVWGLVQNDLLMPAARRYSHNRPWTYHFHGIWAVAMAAALVGLAAAAVLVIVDERRKAAGRPRRKGVRPGALGVGAFALYILVMVLKDFGGI